MMNMSAEQWRDTKNLCSFRKYVFQEGLWDVCKKHQETTIFVYCFRQDWGWNNLFKCVAFSSTKMIESLFLFKQHWTSSNSIPFAKKESVWYQNTEHQLIAWHFSCQKRICHQLFVKTGHKGPSGANVTMAQHIYGLEIRATPQKFDIPKMAILKAGVTFSKAHHFGHPC